mmetsp:Transcript_23725/g.56640  ORF Transcript_23725/g.56640 Transcript_23725/m.56640 type:complete len:296 (+) Transcript_23725:57-944(+)
MDAAGAFSASVSGVTPAFSASVCGVDPAFSASVWGVDPAAASVAAFAAAAAAADLSSAAAASAAASFLNTRALGRPAGTGTFGLVGARTDFGSGVDAYVDSPFIADPGVLGAERTALRSADSSPFRSRIVCWVRSAVIPERISCLKSAGAGYFMMLELLRDVLLFSIADTRIESEVRSRAFSSMVACMKSSLSITADISLSRFPAASSASPEAAPAAAACCSCCAAEASMMRGITTFLARRPTPDPSAATARDAITTRPQLDDGAGISGAYCGACCSGRGRCGRARCGAWPGLCA